MQILGLYLKFQGQSLGYFSPICLVAKFGSLALTRISGANFVAKPTHPPPQPPDMEVPPGNMGH